MVRFAITMVKVFGEEYLRYIWCMYGYSMIDLMEHLWIHHENH